MKVRWGSTLAMLNRAETKRDVSHHLFSFSLVVTHRSLQFVDQFILELRRRETNTEKRRKLADLALTEEEWDRVRLFCNLLQVFRVNALFVVRKMLTSRLSMQMFVSRHFRREHDQRFTTRFLQLKNCTAPGRRHQRSRATAFSSRHFKQPWTS